MSKSKKDLQAEAKKLGIELSGEENANDIQEAINIKKEETGANPDPKPEKKSKEVYFYFLKVKCFKDDTSRADIGLYQTDHLVERFEKLSNDYAQRFDGEIPSFELHKIAEKFRVAIYEKGGKKTRSDEEILAELVKEL